MAKKTYGRKAVYVDTRLWDMLHEEAEKNYDSVTVVLKNAILAYYGIGNNKNTAIKEISTTQKAYEDLPEEEQF